MVALLDTQPAAAEAEAEAEAEPQAVHRNGVCDGCGHPIVGVRYKCGVRSDFDLCAVCREWRLAARLPAHQDRGPGPPP